MEERTIVELQNLGDGNGVLGPCARLGVDPHKGLSNAVPDWSARVETLGANIFEERKLTHSGDYLQTPLGEEQLVLLFMATLEILVKGTTSTRIELQESFAEASSVKAGASSSETEIKCRC